MSKCNLTDEQENLIARMVGEGRSLCEVLAALQVCRTHDVRECFAHYRRQRRPAQVPTIEDMESRRRWVQAQWGPAEWSSRWVGKLALTKETDLQQAASRLLW